MSEAGFAPAPAIAPNGLLLHIGVHKTGTTAIQAALAAARTDLAADGVRYPGKLQAHHRAALAVLGRPWGWNTRGGAVLDTEHFDKLAKRANAHSGRVVISSEFFCEADEATARTVVERLGGERVQVVVTLRNLGRLLSSSWQQYLKYGLTTSYEKWLEDVFANPGAARISPTFWKRHDHGAVLTRWAAAVGPENVSVLILEEVPRDSMFVAFAQMLGVSPEVLTSRMDLTSNRSMTAAEAELLVQLNARVKNEMQWNDYVRLVRRGVALGMVEGREPDPSEPRLVTPDWALDAAAEHGATAATTIGALGVNVYGNLDALAVRVPSSGIKTEPAEVPIAAAVEALASVIAASRDEATSRQLAGRLVRATRKQGISSIFRKDDESR